MWSGNLTTPGQGNWPGTIQMHVRSQPMPKIDGFSFFWAAICSARICSLQERKKNVMSFFK